VSGRMQEYPAAPSRGRRQAFSIVRSCEQWSLETLEWAPGLGERPGEHRHDVSAGAVPAAVCMRLLNVSSVSHITLT
jgi:hypothetical protein